MAELEYLQCSPWSLADTVKSIITSVIPTIEAELRKVVGPKLPELLKLSPKEPDDQQRGIAGEVEESLVSNRWTFQ